MYCNDILCAVVVFTEKVAISAPMIFGYVYNNIVSSPKIIYEVVYRTFNRYFHSRYVVMGQLGYINPRPLSRTPIYQSNQHNIIS